jgi:hypothetical protein
MAETLDEADPGRPHPSDMRVDPRNFLSPFLLNAEKNRSTVVVGAPLLSAWENS